MSERAPEQIKAESDYLRGTLAEELDNDDARFSSDSEILLKFHGIYQQDDRDVRRERTQKKMPLEYICMVRASIPGGALTREQYLAIDKLADEVADGTLRVTTRQGIQYHFTRKGDLRQLIRTLNDNLVTTLAACGDVVRNTMCCPAPFADDLHEAVHEHTQRIARRFRPKTGSYYDVWIDGERAVSAKPVDAVEPLYGTTYLPRKFKIAVAFPGDNCVDAYTQDVAAVAHAQGDEIESFTILVGGGFGVSHADDTTYPRIGTPLTTVSPDKLDEVIEAIIVVQRDNGERGDRKHARLKYLVDRWGMERFKQEVEAVYGEALPAAVEVTWRSADDHLGWHDQGDGKWFIGVRIESGRILDKEDLNLRSALREVISSHAGRVRFTPSQDIILADIEPDRKLAVEAILRKAGVALVESLTPLVRSALACPALPTCGLALTDAERVLPEVVADIQESMDVAGVGDDELVFRMTGCPNGCARPYSAELGLVGRGKTSYDVLVGGSALGTRLAKTYLKNVKRSEITKAVDPLLKRYAEERMDSERFGDWADRVDLDAPA